MERKVLKFNKQDIADLSRDEQKQIIGGAAATITDCVTAFNGYYVSTNPTQDTYNNLTMITNCLENGCTYVDPATYYC
ncbi:class I lanthipeptide [Sphingobacterium sp.]|uniref:class I lanthipeptide n=1 Tax=Sphingobacterium sp. TaxID=341027 RepID=UPI00289BD02E|nr:class I lanthipeptide [Sphingobacterium sp.]